MTTTVPLKYGLAAIITTHADIAEKAPDSHAQPQTHPTLYDDTPGDR